MQTKLRTDKVADTVTPLVSRIAADEELRAHAKTALDSARIIYSRVQADGARRAAARRDVQDEVVKAAAELRQTARRLSEQPKRKSHTLRNLILVSAIVIGAVAATKQVLHHDEDEFDYEP